ncbi:hypothetical protein, partial [Yersinia mollaretii]|uniref:hypothetical protein n=1 Tax=Yersinia mollaretii TaxID=33060 RepID=UPI001C94E0D1
LIEPVLTRSQLDSPFRRVHAAHSACNLCRQYSLLRLRSKEKGKVKTRVLTLMLKAHLSCRVKREGKENGQDARFRRRAEGPA